MTEVSLTETQWEIAHKIAKALVQHNTDANELGKAIAYLRTYSQQNKAGSRFFDYLKTLVRNGKLIGHSQKTAEYYHNIERACSQHLKDYQDNPAILLQILGWVSRLMRYYKNSGTIGEIPPPVTESARQTEIAQVVSSHNFKVGQILEATVTAIKGNKVTYQILGTIKLTEKEPKKANSMTEGKNIKVEVLELKEDGSIKKVKCVD